MASVPEHESRVPLICALNDVNYGEFMNYPFYNGWTKDALDSDANFGFIPPREIIGFFQSWLYFGCLAEVLRIRVGLQFRTTDFCQRVGNEYVITEATLLDLIEEWNERRNQVSPSNIQKILSVLGEIKFYANVRFKQLEQYAGNICIPPFDIDTPSVVRLILNSISGLGFTLQGAVERIHGLSTSEYEWPGSRSPEFRRHRLTVAGWCEWELAEVIGSRTVRASTGFIGASRYIAAIRSPRRNQNHGECNVGGCHVKSVDESQYQTKHVDCVQPCAHIPVPSQLSPIVKRGNTPLIIFREGKLEVIEHSARNEVAYVAISHV